MNTQDRLRIHAAWMNHDDDALTAEILVEGADEIKRLEADVERLTEYLLETSGRLHQLASDHHGLSERDMRELARDMCRVANKETKE